MAVASEVRLPLSNYRVDVAGYRPWRKMTREPGLSFAMECKQSRADFIKDAGCEAKAAAEASALSQRVGALRRLLALHLPACRAGQSLFAEYDVYDFSDWKHAGWARANLRLQRLERRLAGGVKFARIARYGSASYCWLVVEQGLVKAQSEIPLGWGCLQRVGDKLSVLKEALQLDSRPEARLKLLERIAAKAQRPPPA